MKSLSAPMETLVIVNGPGPEKMAMHKMDDTRIAERITEMSNPDNPPIMYVHYTLRCCAKVR